MSSFHYHELAPHPDLAGYVLNYWVFESTDPHAAPYLHHVIPDGCVTLVYVRLANPPWSGLHLMGPRMTELQTMVAPSARYWGARIWPGALRALLGLSAVDLAEQVIAAASRAPELAARLLAALARCDRIETAAAAFDAALQPLLAAAAPIDAFVVAGVRAIVESNGQLPISELTNALGIGERQFQRLFRAEVGLTPKQFSRIRRLRSAMVNAIKPDPEDWSSIACEHGFADQAHLTREFSNLAGFAPTTFQQRVSVIDHGPVKP